MKKMLAGILIFWSVIGFAKNREILCQERPHMSNGSFGIILDQTGLDPNDNLFRVGRAIWGFSYSSANMICSKNYFDSLEKEDLSCIGYNSAGGLTEVSLEIKNGIGTANVHNLGKNIYSSQTEGMTLPCSFRETDKSLVQ
jgi:hypothetical protein